MFARLALYTVRRRRRVLVGAVVAVMLAGGLGSGVIDALTTGGYADPGAESERARHALLEDFGVAAPNFVVLASAPSGTVDSPAATAEGRALTQRLSAEQGVDQVRSYWSSTPIAPLRSQDGKQALILAHIDGDDDRVQEVVERISPEYTVEGGALTSRVGGSAEVARQAQVQIQKDLQRAEMLSAPFLIVLSLLIFGGVVAASLPLVIGAVAVVGTLGLLRVLGEVMEISVFALNLTTALGLGLAIDYSLFMVSRYREERAGGLAHEDAVVRMVVTAGRTVAFSAVTVAASLAALLIFPTVFMRSFAYAGIAVVALAAVAAVVVLPAVIAALGSNLDRWALRRRPPRGEDGFWYRLAMAVMRRPVVSGMAVLIVLLALGSPFLGVQPSLPDHRTLPTSASSRQVQEAVDRGFERGETSNVIVVSRGPTGARTDTAGTARYGADLSRVDGVARVDGAAGSFRDGRRVAPPPPDVTFENRTGEWLSVIPAVEALSPEAEQMVRDLRAVPAPYDVEVGGASAQLVDTKSALISRLPIALAIVALVTFVVLFLFTGSLLVPVKALVLNVLSLTATFGAMVWIFQDGNLSGALDFTATGTLDAQMPILMFCVVFGLSMDYEMFLLSRIKERYDATGDNVLAVASGVQSTGRLLTSAAALIAVVFLAFATSEISFVKLLGIGVAIAVLMDATLVRGILVPAVMRLAGDANWWAPRPLAALHRRAGVYEAPSAPLSSPDPAPAQLPSR